MSTPPSIELNATSPAAIDGRQVRAVAFQDVRLKYVAAAMDALGLTATGRSMLVVGGGKGLLPRGLARMGFAVTSVDPSADATHMARETARHEGLAVDHRTAPAEAPAADEGAFDTAYYADSFEITPDLDRVVEHAARALAPGGVLFYDTVARTLPARLVYLGAFQLVPMTRIMPPGRYAAARLRPPTELDAVLQRHGLLGADVCGFKPRTLSGLVRSVLALRRGTLTDAEIGPAAGFVLDRAGGPVVTYLGYARKD